MNGFWPATLTDLLGSLAHIVGAAITAGGALWLLLRGYIDQKVGAVNRAVADEVRNRTAEDERISKQVFDHADKLHLQMAKLEAIHIQVEKGFARMEGLMEGREQARREWDRDHDRDRGQ